MPWRFGGRSSPRRYVCLTTENHSKKKKKSAAHQCSWAIIIFFCFSFNELKISNPPPHLSLPRDQVGSERFDKEYAYTIRHNYGKEGKRTVGTLFSDPPDE